MITDDSDAFLFGARSVYKNMFDEKKYVEVYLTTDIERELGFRRVDLVSLALLLGSDYTEGVKGVGIVNATEIVQAFCCNGEDQESSAPESGLKKFKAWLNEFDPLNDMSFDEDETKNLTALQQFCHKHRKAR